MVGGLRSAATISVRGMLARKAPGSKGGGFGAQPAIATHRIIRVIAARGTRQRYSYFAFATFSFAGAMSLKQTVRLRPPCLALYSDWSARAMISGFSRASSG